MQAYCIFQRHDVLLLTATMFMIGLQDKLHSVLSCIPCPSGTAFYQASLYSLRHANAQASTLPNHSIKALLQALDEDSAKDL